MAYPFPFNKLPWFKPKPKPKTIIEQIEELDAPEFGYVNATIEDLGSALQLIEGGNRHYICVFPSADEARVNAPDDRCYQLGMTQNQLKELTHVAKVAGIVIFKDGEPRFYDLERLK